MNVLKCALSGETPPTEPVMTPSGYICSKSILLSKFSENGGIDPFSNKPLDICSLIDVKMDLSVSNTRGVQPPRLPKSTSIGGLLHQLKSSYDTLLLELYDVRHALDETRRELSVALYQNDAAVRVIARLSMEHDTAREELARVASSVTSVENEVSGGGSSKKRRVNDTELNVVDMEGEGEMHSISAAARITYDISTATKSLKVDESTKEKQNDEKETEVSDKKIPEEHIKSMINKWKELSCTRRTVRKSKHTTTELKIESIAQYIPTSKKSIYKSSSLPGVLGLALTSGKDGVGSGRVIATVCKDKQVILYDTVDEKVKCTIHTNNHCNGCIDILRIPHSTMEKEDKDGYTYVTCFAGGDRTIECWFDAKSNSSYKMIEGDNVRVVNVSIHPNGRHVFLTTNNGMVHVLLVRDDHDKMVKLAILEEADTKYTTAKLHPDGLILAAGRKDGKVSVWDLKTQSMASLLKGLKNHAITALAFSHNGYHLATATSEGAVVVWDLRKQKIVATLHSLSTSPNKTMNGVYSLTFDPSGRILACGTSNNEIIIVAVKDPENVMTLTDEKKDNRNNNTNTGRIVGLVWYESSIVSCNDIEQNLTFWGVSEKTS